MRWDRTAVAADAAVEQRPGQQHQRDGEQRYDQRNHLAPQQGAGARDLFWWQRRLEQHVTGGRAQQEDVGALLLSGSLVLEDHRRGTHCRRDGRDVLGQGARNGSARQRVFRDDDADRSVIAGLDRDDVDETQALGGRRDKPRPRAADLLAG